MAAKTTARNRIAESTYTRQRQAVMDHLMKAAFGDPQVHYRMHASPDFRAALKALDPDLPQFLQDEGARNMLMIGCLHVIDVTAEVLKYARENDLRLVAPGGK
jgi:hypothetical protein